MNESRRVIVSWVVFLCLLPFQLMFGLIYAWGSIAPVIRAQSGWPDAVLDVAFSVTPLFLFPSVLLGGYLAGRIEPRRVLIGALACFVLGGIVGLCTTSSLSFIIGYGCIALGLGAGLSTPACVALIGRAMPKNRGRWSGALLAIYGSSAVVSVPGFDLLVAHWPWRPALGILMGIYAVLGIIALWGMPAALKPQYDRAGTPAMRIPAWQWRAALPIAINALLLLVTVPFGSLIFATLGRLALSAGFPARVGVTAVTLMALFNGVGRFAGGWLSDVTSAPTARTIMLACAVAGYGALLVSMHGHGAAAWFLALPVLAGFAFGGLAGKLPALAAHTSSARATEVFSLYFGVFALGSFGGPLLSAVLGFTTALTLCGVMALAGLVASLILLIDPAL